MRVLKLKEVLKPVGSYRAKWLYQDLNPSLSHTLLTVPCYLEDAWDTQASSEPCLSLVTISDLKRLTFTFIVTYNGTQDVFSILLG